MLTVKLSEVIDYLSLKELQGNKDYEQIKINSDYVYRFGIELMGEAQTSLGPGRIVVMGESEAYFLKKLDQKEKNRILEVVFSRNFATLVTSYEIIPEPIIFEFAKKYSIPIFTSNRKTALLMSDLTNFLEEHLEETITRPAGLMSIYGEGVLITGESGIGKSEVALELIHRGHKFVSDDLTEIRRLSIKTLVGFSPGNISNFIEVRGIGIINVHQLFGINSIKKSETIDMIVNFEIWKDEKEYDRLGSVERYVEILGIQVPYVSIPVKPGKNLAVLTEVAAMNNRVKKYGWNPYGELMEKICGMEDLIPKSSIKEKAIWEK